jgi:hypothetical protein
MELVVLDVPARPLKTGERDPERHHHARGVLALALIASISTVLTSPGSSFAGSPHAAHLARSLDSTATAYLHLIRVEGSQLFEKGPVSGGFVGSMQAELSIGAIYTGSFTITTHSGSIKGNGRATPHGSGRYQSFSGSFLVTSGSGRYAHVHGHAGLYGVFDRRTDAVVVQTTGKLAYKN